MSLALVALAALAAQPSIPIPASVVAGLVEVRKAAKVGDQVWPGFSAAPFGFLLVHAAGETLICDKRVPDGFTAGPREPQLGCPTAYGPASWRKPQLLAAMPAFGPGEVIVMGSPAASGLDPGSWRRTVLHEHFHQWQGALPNAYARIDALGLANGDQTGMWMLNYPFPYENADVAGAFADAAERLDAALNSDIASLSTRARSYWSARERLRQSVSPAEWRYFDFQLWKEGVARWTEIEVARRAGGEWRTGADAAWEKQLSSLAEADLPGRKRESVYAFGAAEAALLERIDPRWRNCYPAAVALTTCWEGAKARLDIQ